MVGIKLKSIPGDYVIEFPDLVQVNYFLELVNTGGQATENIRIGIISDSLAGLPALKRSPNIDALLTSSDAEHPAGTFLSILQVGLLPPNSSTVFTIEYKQPRGGTESWKIAILFVNSSNVPSHRISWNPVSTAEVQQRAIDLSGVNLVQERLSVVDSRDQANTAIVGIDIKSTSDSSMQAGRQLHVRMSRPDSVYPELYGA